MSFISLRVSSGITVGGAGGGGFTPLRQRSSSILVRFAIRIMSANSRPPSSVF